MYIQDRDHKWNIRYLDLIENGISKWSKDPSTKVGSIIVDQQYREISHGYNGYPYKLNDINLDDREYKYQRTIHAELNAILYAKRDLSGCKIYIYPFLPCSECMKCIIQVGITEVICKVPFEKDRPNFHFKTSINMAAEAGLTIYKYDEENRVKLII